MEVNLHVPFKSEEDPDGNLSTMDCGATCLAMVLNYYDPTLNLATNQIVQYLNDTSAINLDQLVKAAASFGYVAEYRINQNFDNVKKFLDAGIPVIAVVHAGDLQSRQDKQYTGGHYILLDGYRSDNSVYVNDPDFFGDLRQQGDHHVYTSLEFMTAWANTHQDGNAACSFLVVYKKEANLSVDTESVPSKLTVSSDAGVRGRTQPTVNTANIVKVYKKGTEFDVIEKVTGDSVNGNSAWYSVKETPNPVFVWSGAVSVSETTNPIVTPANPAANVVTPDISSDYLTGLITVYETTKDILVSHNALPGQTVADKSTGFWAKVKGAFNIL